ncbi:MAG: hypothetical protein WC637_11075, partial [Victivallales bacterium]
MRNQRFSERHEILCFCRRNKVSLRNFLLLVTFLVMSAVLCMSGLAQGELPLNILRAPGPVVIDGKLDDWVLTAPVSYGMDSKAFDNRVRTYAAWDDEYLYLAYVVRDASPMKNAGSDPSGAFKTGDALHLYLSTDSDPVAPRSEGGPNDFHILMTVQQGKSVVYAFRQQKPGITDQTFITAAGGASKIGMAWMGPVSGADLAVMYLNDPQGYKAYAAEVKIPWKFFDGLTPGKGLKLAMDVAVDFSDPAGTRNMAKVWWHRGASQVSDLPTELRFERNRWGAGELREAGQTPIVIDPGNLFVVPAPAKMAIDGDLKDWDLSCAYGPQAVDPQLKEKNHVTWTMMYDADALYLGAILKSERPIRNEGGVDNVWWKGDSLEFRLAADPKRQNGDPKLNDDILSFGIWYNNVEDKDYIAVCRSFKFTVGDNSMMTVRSKAVEGGRSFEARIPWTVVKSGNYPKSGDDVACTLTGLWSSGPRAFGMGSINSFRAMNDWGQAHFLSKGRQPLVYRQLEPPVDSLPRERPAKYNIKLDVPQKGLLSAGVYSPDGRLLRTLLAGRQVNGAGPQDIGWDGFTDDDKLAGSGRYEVRALVNGGLRAQYVMSPYGHGDPPHQSDNLKHGWGGGMAPVMDIAADASAIYPVWGYEEAVGVLLRLDKQGNLIWRQHMPLALHGIQTAVASNGKYVFVSTGSAGLWRVRCTDGVYAPFSQTGTNNPMEFHLEGINRSAGGKIPAGEPSMVPALAADARTLYASSYYQNQVVCFDAESGARLNAFDVPQPNGLCLDGADGLLVVSGKQLIRLDLKGGKISGVLASGLDKPWHLAIDKDGNLLVTDRGSSQQVKKYDRTGKLQGSYGMAGGRDNNGKYSPDKLLAPSGIAVAPWGKVYFSEQSEPRIMMQLDSNLKYERLWSGPWYLSGEVSVDPYQPDHFYHTAGGLVRYVFDEAGKTSQPDAVWSRWALPKFTGWIPRIIEHQGQRYLFSSSKGMAGLVRIRDYDLKLIAAVTGGSSFTDRNENGRVDDGEQIPVGPVDGTPLGRLAYWNSDIDESDLSMYLYYPDGPKPHVIVVQPTFLRPGVPVYDFTKTRVIPLTAAKKNAKSNIASIWHMPDGGVFGNADAPGSDPRGLDHSSHLSDVYVFRLDKDGKLLWRAGKKASGLAREGEFYGRACGLGGPLTDEYFQFSDEGGQDLVYTNDGLYVGKLLDDAWTGVRNEYTLCCEHFNTCVYQNRINKRWYIAAGGDGFANLWEVV